MKYTYSEILRRLRDVPRKGWAEHQIKDLIDTLWREEFINRTSGFDIAGSPDSQMSFDTATRTFTIEPVKKRFAFWQFIFRIAYFKRTEAETIQLPDEEGLYMIYIYRDDEDPTHRKQKLFYIQNPSEDEIREVYLNRVIVAWLYWPKPGNSLIYFGDERHGSQWEPNTHWWAHRAFNAIRESGLRITDITYGDGSQDADAQFGVTAGTFLHEDMRHEIAEVPSTVGLPIFYRWANAGAWPRFYSNNEFPVQPTGDGLIYFNTNSGQLLPADDDTYVLCHTFASNCRINEVFAVMGQTQYSSLRDAFAGAQAELDEIRTWMPHQTRLHISTLVYHTSWEYTNTPNARIVAEITPESLAEVVAEDVVPYVKTGWSPQVQEEILFSFNAGTRRLTLDIQKAEVPYFVKGKSMKLTSDVLLTIADTTGLHYLTAGQYTFESVQNRWDEYTANYAYISAIYWNARQQYACHVGWRMHLWEMEPKTRGNILKKTGLERVSGFGITINDAEGMEHTIHVEEGTLRLADITVNVADGGGGNHRQQLTPLEARRYYLKTYVDDTDPENPVITHEWEYQATPLVNIAKISAANEVEINEFAEGAWMLTETTDGDYTAMWLIGTLCSEQPLKWISGQFASADLDEARELNNPESLLQILSAAQMVDYKGVLSRVIVKNIPDEPYYELIEKRDYEDGEFEKDLNDRHVVDVEFNEISRELTLFRNAGLPSLKAEIPGGEQQQADWTQNDTGAVDFIKNKPSIPDPQVQADWNQTNTFAPDFIKNKPEIPDPSQTSVEVEQPDHGFTVGQAIRHDGITYVLALADNDVNAQVCGIISEIIDTHNFRYTTDGFISGNWIAGDEYFLSPVTPGLLITLPEPEVWAIGQVRISLGWGTTQGLKVEIDTGDLIDELPTVKLSGIWDREFEFCINQGYPEIFTVDYWAVYPYTILELIIGVDDGTLPGSSIQINGIPVGGLGNVSIGSKALTLATGSNEVLEGMEVTLNTSGDFTGDPQVIKGKLKILRE